ncbi:MAG: hypothetical protein GY926_13800 [bacterium]|nr:hypothetical protein [bacterium]
MTLHPANKHRLVFDDEHRNPEDTPPRNGEDGTQCIRDVDGEWQVLDQPSKVAYVVGGGADLLGYPNYFEYDEAVFSENGLERTSVTLPSGSGTQRSWI